MSVGTLSDVTAYIQQLTIHLKGTCDEDPLESENKVRFSQ